MKEAGGASPPPIPEGSPMSDTRQHAHLLIDRLPETQLSGLVQFLETIVDPVTTALRNAPLDDEPETDEEKAAVAEARDWLKSNGGKGIPHEEVLADFGLSMDDFRRMGEQSAQRRQG